MGKGHFSGLCDRFTYSTPELTQQVRRFIWARLLLYLGAMSSYFIGVMGTLTFAMGAGVGDNAIAVGLLNLCIVFGRFAEVVCWTAWDRHFYLRIAVAGLVASGLLYQVVGTSVVGVYIGAAVFGFAWGMAETIPRSYPAYLTDDLDELKRINALVTLTGNIAIVVGRLWVGRSRSWLPRRRYFLFMVACSALALIPGWGDRGFETAW